MNKDNITSTPSPKRGQVFLSMKSIEQIKKAKVLNNYWNLDNCRWSDAPAVDAMIEELTKEGIKTRKQKTYMEDLKANFKIILLNLYHAYINDPERYVQYSRSSKRYSGDLKLSYDHVIEVTDFLRNKGKYITQEPGYPGSKGYEPKITKIKATSELVKVFEKHGISPEMLERDTSDVQLVRLKGKKLKDGARKPRKITRKPRNFKEMEDNLRLINKVIDQSVITLDISRAEMGWLNMMLNEDNDPYRHAVDLSRKTYYRTFINGVWNNGGRFYGPWWVNLPSDYRTKIMIDGSPVLEPDFSAYHPRLLYALNKAPYPDEEPYQLDGYPQTKAMRKFLKNVLLSIVNNVKPDVTTKAIRSEYRKQEEKAKRWNREFEDLGLGTLTDKLLWDIMSGLMKKHSAISNFFFSGYGNALQYIDSMIAEQVMLYFAKQGIPCLSIHDSFIVNVPYVEPLREFTDSLISHNFGVDIPLKDNFIENESRLSEIAFRQLREGLRDGTIDEEALMADFEELKNAWADYKREHPTN